MDNVLNVVNVLGLTGGIVFLGFLFWDLVDSLRNSYLKYRMERDLKVACTKLNVAVEELQIDTEGDTITGILVQRELKHGFRVAYSGKYNPRAMDVMLRAVAEAAGFDVPKAEEA